MVRDVIRVHKIVADCHCDVHVLQNNLYSKTRSGTDGRIISELGTEYTVYTLYFHAGFPETRRLSHFNHPRPLHSFIQTPTHLVNWIPRVSRLFSRVWRLVFTPPYIQTIIPPVI